MVAKIYRPARTAMQSGRARTKAWMLVHERDEPRRADPLMGWISSGETKTQVKLAFDTKEQAIAYAEKHGLAYQVHEPEEVKPMKAMSYSDNFKYTRVGQWTH